MSHCWYKLKISVKDCFLPGYKFPTPTGRYGVWHPKATEVFNNQWLQYVKSIGIPVYSAMIFYRDSYAHTAQAHVDIGKPDPFVLTNFAINWCYGGEGSEMVWYETPTKKKEISYTAANTPYMAWDIPDLKEIERTHLGEEVSLVRTGVPHAIKMEKEPRWVFSARCSIPDNIEWERALEILREKDLLIER
jgi:hypothetical protein